MTFAVAADGKVTGFVFRDYNSNGTKDAASTTKGTVADPGVAGVTVTAYDSTGKAVGATTTGADGNYSLSVAGAATDDVRVEFTTLPGGTFASWRGKDNGTSVQFVKLSASPKANFGLLSPQDYCQDNPDLAYGCQRFGDPVNGVNGKELSMQITPYDAKAHDQATAPSKVIAKFSETGSYWGLTYPRVPKGADKFIYTAAYFRTSSGLGPGGTGAIYQTAADGKGTKVFADLNKLFGAGTAGTDPRTGYKTNTARNLAGAGGNKPGTWAVDTAWDSTGKVALGGLTTDDTNLYTVNLADKQLYILPLSGPTAENSSRVKIPVDLPGAQKSCPESDTIPFAAQYKDGKVFVGITCNARSTQKAGDLRAYVYTYDVAAKTWSSKPAFEWELVRPAAAEVSYLGIKNNGLWNPWVNKDPWDVAKSATHKTYPMPLLEGITFDGEDMIFGIRDMFGDINRTYNPGSTRVASGGDLVRACLVSGSYQLENAGKCGSRGPSTSAKNGQGPGGGEFYNDTKVTSEHEETSHGGVWVVPGRDKLAWTGMDSRRLWTGGVTLSSNIDGSQTAQKWQTYPSVDWDTFQKSNGMTDIESLCDAAPLEIGNYVWIDENKDGIQDPGEKPVPGVTVRLYDETGRLVATQVTDAKGEYYFNDNNVTGGLKREAKYTIKLDKPEDYAAGGPLDGYKLTTTDAGTKDTIDSDGVMKDGFPVKEIRTGKSGENDHSFDFGFNKGKPDAIITKRDQVTKDEADTAATAITFDAGETRTIEMPVDNTGTEDLAEVSVSDKTFAGDAKVTDLQCVFPGDTTATAAVAQADGSQIVKWAPTFSKPPTRVWKPGEKFTCTAKLTLPAGAKPHADKITLDAKAAADGTPIKRDNDFHAVVPGIDIVKFDKRDATKVPPNPVDGPDAKDGTYGGATKGDWDPKIDADTEPDAVIYPLNGATTGKQPIGFIVTNTGKTKLTNVVVDDTTITGPKVTDIVCTFPDGKTGTTWAGMFAIGASFPCAAMIELKPGDKSHDIAGVVADVVDLKTDKPNGKTVNDEDPYHAKVPGKEDIDITKRDKETGKEADTADDPLVFNPGETRTIEMPVTNTGTTDLVEVLITDRTFAGDAKVTDFECMFPGATAATKASPAADGSQVVKWDATFATPPTAKWKPGEKFVCTAKLTLPAGAKPHGDKVRVDAKVDGTGKPLNKDNDFNAVVPGIDIVKFDNRDATKVPPNPVDGPDKKDGTYSGETKGSWDAKVDADTAANAVEYPLNGASTGKQPIGFIVTNTGKTKLTNVVVDDTTIAGPKVTDIACTFPDNTKGTTWAGMFEIGASFPCTAMIELKPGDTSHDIAGVTADVVDPETGKPDGKKVDDEDPFHAKVPGNDEPVITKRDKETGKEADTADDPMVLKPGETRVIEMPVENRGTGDLVEVAVSDRTFAGDVKVTDFECTFPGATAPTKADANNVVKWAETFGTPAARKWKPGEKFTCTAKLTLPAGAKPHGDKVRVDAKSDATGKPVYRDNDFHAKVGGIDIVKFDGRDASKVPPKPVDGPDKKDGNYGGETKGAWDPKVDADTEPDGVLYPLNGGTTGAQKVSAIVTNTGQVDLANVVVDDLTKTGPDVKGWVCTFPDGSKGLTWAGLFKVGASFPCEGTLELKAGEKHHDIAGVIAETTDKDGKPDGKKVDDEDPFHVRVPDKEEPIITKRDKETGKEADTADDPMVLKPGETRVIEMPVENRGTGDLVEVAVSDRTFAGDVKVTDFECTFPGATAPTKADASNVVKWAETFGTPPDRKWKAGEKFTCTAKLTLPAGAKPHGDKVRVDAKSDATGKPVFHENDFHAKVPGIDIVKFDGRDASKIPPKPVDGPDKKDGEYGGATNGSWDAKVDADTEANGVVYPVNGATTGPQKVSAIVTNTGEVALANVVVDDLTKTGPEVKGWTCTFPDGSKGLTWAGLFKVGASFPCEGTLELKPGEKHHDIAGVIAETTDKDGKPDGKKIDDEDPFHAKVPDKEEPIITKRDKETGKEADTADDPMIFKAGETRTIEMPVENRGTGDLVEVVITDRTFAGDVKVTDLECTFPGATAPAKADASNVVKWAETFGTPAARKWKPGEKFTCTAKLTLPAGSKLHGDKVRVDAKVDGSGKPVYNENDFHAKVPGIDIVKFDGRDASKIPPKPVDGPDKKDGNYGGETKGAWDPKVDADTEPDGVVYPLNGGTTGAQKVSAIVTNTGEVDLANVVVDDLTKTGPAVKNWVCTFPDGSKGLTWPGLFKVGASFPCEGTLELKAGEKHHDIAGVIAESTDKDGKPDGKKVDDEDPFHAKVPNTEDVEITKRDKETGKEADTANDPLVFNPGETRVIEMPVTNTGTAELVEVLITDKTFAGDAKVTDFECTFPGAATATKASPGADGSQVVKWDATFANPPTQKWKPGEKFTCTAKLTLPAGAKPHGDKVRVDAKVDGSGKPLNKDNDFHAKVPGIDIVKFDGRDASKIPPNPVDGPDKKDGYYNNATAGSWDRFVDADSSGGAATYQLNGATTGPQKVSAIVTNTGQVDLANIVVDDLTREGPEVKGWVCTFPDGSKGLTWAGLFKVGASFPCEGTLELKPGEKHHDIAGVIAETTDKDGKPDGKKVDDEDPFHVRVPDKEEPIITKRDKETGKEADTADDPMVLKPGETRVIEMPVENRGTADLVEVAISDRTFAGEAKVSDFECTFPGQTTPTKADASNVVKWAETFGSPPARKWKTGEKFSCTAKLTLPADAKPHADKVRVDAKVDGSGKPVYNENDFHAKVGSIDIVKFDGRDGKPKPPNPVDGADKKDGTYGGETKGGWDPRVDADTEANAASYAVNGATTGPQKISAIVTNTGQVDLANVVVDDLTKAGPAVKGWVCTFPDGSKGLTWPGLLKVGASFPCEGTLELKPGEKHHDIGGVIAETTDKNGKPDGKKVDDEDPFHVRVDEKIIDKKDKETGQQADTADDAIVLKPGEDRYISFKAINVRMRDMSKVQITDKTIAGDVKVTEFECVFPGSSTPVKATVAADGTQVVRWEETFATPPRLWKPNEQIDCSAKLTLPAGAKLHTDVARVKAVFADDGTPVEDEDPYNAKVGSIDIVKFDARDGKPKPPNPVDGPDKKDGEYGGATRGGWDLKVDADTDADAAVYPVNGATTGPQKVMAIVTNTGQVDLANVVVDDLTKAGPAVKDWKCTFPDGSKGLAWAGLFKVGTSFPCEGTLELKPGEKHHDIGGVVADPTDKNGKPYGKKVDDEDPLHVKVPDKEEPIITKRDKETGKEADAADDPMIFKAGETRTIEMPVENRGSGDLVEVVISDKTFAGEVKVTDFECTFPGQAAPTKADANNAVRWSETFGSPPARKWKQGEKFTCTAKLTLPPDAKPHGDKVRVDAKADGSGKPVINENDFHAKVGGIDIVKFDGRDGKPKPPNPVDGADKKDGTYGGETKGGWDPIVDADTEANSAVYPSGPQKVSAIVTNTGQIDLANIVVDDMTKAGPAVKNWVCTFPDGTKGLTWPGLLKVGASFPCEGTLDVKPGEKHHDIGGVTAETTDKNGKPDGKKVDDEDPFHVRVPEIAPPPEPDITKRDKETKQEADTAADAMAFRPGETRTIEMPVEHRSGSDLVEVVISDKTIAGDAKVSDFECTFPGATSPAKADANNVVKWDATFGTPPARKWKAGEKFTCTAKLTLPPGAKPHADKVRIDGKADGTGAPVTKDNDFHAKVGSIDIVKFDGRDEKKIPANPVDGPDKKDGNYGGPTRGDWDPKTDADTEADAVTYEAKGGKSGPQPVWAIVTNTGDVPLANIAIEDKTVAGESVKDWVCAFPDGKTGMSWAGPLAPKQSFRCKGTLGIPAGTKHHDIASVTAETVDKDGKADGRKVDDEDAYHVRTDGKDEPIISKRDKETGKEADTAEDAIVFTSGETRTIEMPAENRGTSDLVEVVITDRTFAGEAKVTSFECTFPGQTSPTKADASNVVRWAESLGSPPSRKWKPGEKFTCTAQLTLAAGAKPHADRVRVDAKADGTGKPVYSDNDFHAKVGGIDIQKYDAALGRPEPYDPSKVNSDAARDADTTGNAVKFQAGQEREILFAVKNTGEESLRDVTVSDQRTGGTGDVTGLTCDFSKLGGPGSGTSWAGPFLPGTWFFCTGKLTLPAGADHVDKASVSGTGTISGVKYGAEDPLHAKTDPAPPVPPAPPKPVIPIIPVTGSAVTGVIVVGLLLVGAGALLLLRRPRRRNVS
ncbi:SdrD B-like domain-containing protein [Longispora albida]|uniref:SdrD B-like domain-containing protein n=1 Tax=Longispora albida TaxID=203523 RepID=UPI003CCBD26C